MHSKQILTPSPLERLSVRCIERLNTHLGIQIEHNLAMIPQLTSGQALHKKVMPWLNLMKGLLLNLDSSYITKVSSYITIR